MRGLLLLLAFVTITGTVSADDAIPVQSPACSVVPDEKPWCALFTVAGSDYQNHYVSESECQDFCDGPTTCQPFPGGEECTRAGLGTEAQACVELGGRKIEIGDYQQVDSICRNYDSNPTQCNNSISYNGIQCTHTTITRDGVDSDICLPSWTINQCPQYCFLDKKGQTDLNCYENQDICLQARDTLDADEVMWPACGEQASDQANNCVAKNLHCRNESGTGNPFDPVGKAECLSINYEDQGLVCDFYDDGAFGDGDVCGVKMDNECKNFCFVSFDGDNEPWCYATQSRCLNAAENHDPRYISRNVCGEVNNKADEVEGTLINFDGISVPLNLQFEPFQDFGGLYNNTERGLPNFVNSLVKLVIGLAGVLAVLVIVAGGFSYITSAASPQKNKAKTNIKNGVLGLGLTLTAVLLLNTINPRLLELDPIDPISLEINVEEYSGTTIRTGDFTNIPICLVTTDGEGNESTECFTGSDAADQCEEAQTTCSETDPDCSVAAECSDVSVQSLAQQVIDHPAISIQGEPNGRVFKAFEQVAAEGRAQIGNCDNGETLPNQWTEVSPQLMHNIIQIGDFAAANGEQVALSSLTTGEHSCRSTHYKGLAVDIGSQGTTSLPNVARYIFDNHEAMNVRGLIHNPMPSGTSLIAGGNPTGRNKPRDDSHKSHIHMDVNP